MISALQILQQYHQTAFAYVSFVTFSAHIKKTIHRICFNFFICFDFTVSSDKSKSSLSGVNMVDRVGNRPIRVSALSRLPSVARGPCAV